MLSVAITVVDDDFDSGTATSWTRQNITSFDSASFAPLCENMTSSTKPEVHNIVDSWDLLMLLSWWRGVVVASLV